MSSVNHPLILSLVLVLILFSVFAWFVRRGILQAKEVIWIGAALTFFATSLIFNAVLVRTRLIYGAKSLETLVGMTALMTVPLILALAYGVYALSRSVQEKRLAEVQIDGLTLQLVLGNIATIRGDEPLDALVNPTNTRLTMGAGVGGGAEDVRRQCHRA